MQSIPGGEVPVQSIPGGEVPVQSIPGGEVPVRPIPGEEAAAQPSDVVMKLPIPLSTGGTKRCSKQFSFVPSMSLSSMSNIL